MKEIFQTTTTMHGIPKKGERASGLGSITRIKIPRPNTLKN